MPNPKTIKQRIDALDVAVKDSIIPVADETVLLLKKDSEFVASVKDVWRHSVVKLNTTKRKPAIETSHSTPTLTITKKAVQI
jgi:hypothetical protein